MLLVEVGPPDSLVSHRGLLVRRASTYMVLLILAVVWQDVLSMI